MLERCNVADGGKMLLKFLDPGFLKRWREEPEKSRVSACSSWPAPPRGNCTTGCLDSITRITLPWRRWPFRWLIAVGKKSSTKKTQQKSLRLWEKDTGSQPIKIPQWRKRVFVWKNCLTKLSLGSIAHLDQSVFLLVEEDFHSLNVPVNTCEDIKAHGNGFEVLLSHTDRWHVSDSHQIRWRGNEARRSAETKVVSNVSLTVPRLGFCVWPLTSGLRLDTSSTEWMAGGAICRETRGGDISDPGTAAIERPADTVTISTHFNYRIFQTEGALKILLFSQKSSVPYNPVHLMYSFWLCLLTLH